MSNGKMLNQLRELAGKKEIDTDAAMQLSLSATADVLETVEGIRGDHVKLKKKVDSMDKKLTSISEKLNGYHKIVEALQINRFVKLGNFIDNHKSVSIVIGIIVIIFIVPELRHVMIEWLMDSDNIIGLFK